MSTTFREQVEKLLAIVYDGLHHVDAGALSRARFEESQPPFAEIVLYDGGGLATYDFDQLTRLVVAAHDLCIRVEVRAATRQYFRLRFHPRQRDAESMTRRHPTLEEAAAHIRESRYYPAVVPA